MVRFPGYALVDGNVNPGPLNQHKTLDVITLFHRSSLPSSTRVLNLLKNTSARAAESPTDEKHRPPFELDVTEAPPTTDQLRSILEYVGGHKSRLLVDGAKDEEDAIEKLSQDPKRFKAPVVCCFALNGCLPTPEADDLQTVDWNNGRAGKHAEIVRRATRLIYDAVVGDNESDILRLLNHQPA
jgi:arsenate reductase-like glutaredoxin family protein